MKTPLLGVLLFATFFSNAQRIVERTQASWELHTHSVETYKDIVFTAFTDKNNVLSPSVKITDINGNFLHTFIIDGFDHTYLMDFAIRPKTKTLIFVGYTDKYPYRMVITETDYNGNVVNSFHHFDEKGRGLIPHQVVIAEDQKIFSVVGMMVKGEMDKENYQERSKWGFVMGFKLDDPSTPIWTLQTETPQVSGAKSDNDLLESIVLTPEGFFMAGSANHPEKDKQILLTMGVDFQGNPVHAVTRDNSDHYMVSASLLYSETENQVYLLNNNSSLYRFQLSSFDPYTGAQTSPYFYSYPVSGLDIGGGVAENGFKLQEYTEKKQLLVTGYFTCKDGSLPNLITPYQLAIGTDFSFTTGKLFDSDDNFNETGYFSMAGASVYANTPDIMAYNFEFDRTFTVTPNPLEKGYDLQIARALKEGPCEKRLDAVMVEHKPKKINKPEFEKIPVISDYFNQFYTPRDKKEKVLCSSISGPIIISAAMTIAPNPATALVEVTISEPIATITILDMNGDAVLETAPERVHASTMSINIENLKAGVYMLSVTDANGNVSREKFIKM